MALSEYAANGGADNPATLSPKQTPAGIGGASEEAYGPDHPATFSHGSRQLEHHGEPSEIACPLSCCA